MNFQATGFEIARVRGFFHVSRNPSGMPLGTRASCPHLLPLSNAREEQVCVPTGSIFKIAVLPCGQDARVLRRVPRADKKARSGAFLAPDQAPRGGTGRFLTETKDGADGVGVARGKKMKSGRGAYPRAKEEMPRVLRRVPRAGSSARARWRAQEGTLFPGLRNPGASRMPAKRSRELPGYGP